MLRCPQAAVGGKQNGSRRVIRGRRLSEPAARLAQTSEAGGSVDGTGGGGARVAHVADARRVLREFRTGKEVV